MTDVYDTLARVLTAEFEVKPDAVHEDATLDDLGLDSLAQVDLADRIAELFDVQVPDEELAATTTLARLVTLLEQKRADRS